MTTQGSRRTTKNTAASMSAETNGHPLLGNVLDLDAELDSIDLAPVPMKIGGKVYEIRRDLTGQEIADYYRLADESSAAEKPSTRSAKQIEALSLLLVTGADAAALSAILDALPQQRMVVAVRRIMATAGLVTDSGQLGE